MMGERLIRGSRNEYIPANKAVIPTPEEEALDDLRRKHEKANGPLLLLMLIGFATVLFRDEIVEIAKGIFG